jgi:hypothetical protein
MGALFDLSTEVEQVIKEGESEVIECEGFYKQVKQVFISL